MLIKYPRGIEKLETESRKDPPRLRDIKVRVHWGVAGAGKSWDAMMNHEEKDVFILEKPDHGPIRWDGYTNQKVLIIEDFRGWISFSTLLRLLDKYPFKMNVKYGYAKAHWTTVYITANIPPQEWYPSKGYPPQLERRLHEVIEYTTPYVD